MTHGPGGSVAKTSFFRCGCQRTAPGQVTIPRECSAPQTSPRRGSGMGAERQGQVSDAGMPHCPLSRTLALLHCRAGRRPAAARSLRIAVKAQRADQGTDRAKEEGAARAGRAVPGGHWGKPLLSPAVTTLEPSVGGPSLPDDAHSGCRDTGSPTSLLGLKVGAHPDCQVPRPPQAQVEKSRSRGSSSSSAKAHCHPSNSPGGQRGLTSPPQAHCPQTLNPRHRRQRRPQ